MPLVEYSQVSCPACSMALIMQHIVGNFVGPDLLNRESNHRLHNWARACHPLHALDFPIRD